MLKLTFPQIEMTVPSLQYRGLGRASVYSRLSSSPLTMSSAFVTRSEIWVHHVSDFVLVFFPIVSKVDSVTRREIVQKLR